MLHSGAVLRGDAPSPVGGPGVTAPQSEVWPPLPPPMKLLVSAFGQMG